MAIEIKNTIKGVRYKAIHYRGKLKVRSKTFDRKKDAELWLSRQKMEAIDTALGRDLGRNITLLDFVEENYWAGNTLKPDVARDYKSTFNVHINPSLGKFKLTEITANDFVHFRSKLLKNGVSKTKVNRVHTTLSAILSFAVKIKVLRFNPLLGMDRLKENLASREIWTLEEAKKFLQYVHDYDADWYGIFLALYVTGMRVGELMALKWDCVNFAKNSIVIRRAFSRVQNAPLDDTKGNKQRTVFMRVELKKVLLQLKMSSKSEFVFSHPDGRRIRDEHIRKWFDRFQEAAGVKSIQVHGIRHSFATHHLEGGGSIYDLKILMGHSKIETTERYLHLSNQHIQKNSQIVGFTPVVDNDRQVIEIQHPSGTPESISRPAANS